MTEKTLNTLVEDVERVLLEGAPIPDGLWEKYEPLLREDIFSNIEQTRRGEERKHLYASELGLPDRKVWANHNWTDVPDDIRANVKAMFLFGNIWEPIFLMLAEVAGHTVEQCQEKIQIEDDEGNVICSGRRDAVVDGVPIDVKTAASRSFEKFKTGELKTNDLFGYIPQLGFYLQNAEPSPDSAAFLVADRAMGHMTVLELKKEEFPDTKARAKELWDIVQQPEPPEKCYDDIPDGASGNKRLDVGCAYCKFKHRCWPGLRTFIYSNGPRFLTHVERIPNVIEVNEKGDRINVDST